MASKKEKKTENPNTGHRRFSKSVTDTDERAASRGMLYGLGFKKGDFRKSQATPEALRHGPEKLHSTACSAVITPISTVR